MTNGIFGIQQFADEFFDLNPIPVGLYGIGRFRFDERTVWVLLLGWSLVALATVFLWKLTRSPWGRAMRAIREDEDAALSLGKNVFGYKLQSLMIGGAIGALAGMFLAIDQQNVNPDAYIPLLTFYAFTIVILGGPGTLFGPIVGSVIFWFLFEFLDGVMTALIVDMDVALLDALDATAVGPIRFALFGAGLMWLMIYRPQGLFGSKEEMLVDAG